MNKVFKIDRTHIGATRTRQTNQLQEVCELMQWTKEAYCQYQYEQYEAFAERIAADYPASKQQLRYSATFRGFWNNDWADRNEAYFLPLAYDADNLHDIRQEYFAVHSVDRLISDDLFYNKFESILNIL